MAKLLLAASIVWPTLLGSAWWASVNHTAYGLSVPTYLVASRVCHQRLERTFWIAGQPLPVCGRCTGLYLAAPFGALAAVFSRRNRSRMPPIGWLIAAAIPTALTFALEHFGVADISNATRALSALPLGAATAFYVIAVASQKSEVRS
jgi:uncharacterized membrane protein